MKLYIPEISDQLKLSSDWSFKLHREYRNASVIDHYPAVFGEKFKWGPDRKPEDFTLPKGTVLAVDRIYIRKGAQDFSSLTFRIISHPTEKIKSGRFWAKLEDCNKIEFEIESLVIKKKLPQLHYSYYDYHKGSEWWHLLDESHPDQASCEGEIYTQPPGRYNDRTIIFKVRIDADLEWKSKDYKHGIFNHLTSTTWDAFVKKVTYTLITPEGKEIGSWGTTASLKKNAKTYLEQQ